MGDTTEISWADKTFNPWIGCTETSPACDRCYAKTLASRWGWVEWGAGKPRKRTSAANWQKPLQWERAAARDGTRPRVFCASLADWADKEIPPTWRRDLFDDAIRPTPHLEWLLLSKRHSLVLSLLGAHARNLTNIRIGFTIEDDHHARMRLPYLRKIKEAGWPTFVSYEPALGAVDWAPWMDCIDWLIAGGESGHGARHPDPRWFRESRDTCRLYKVPFHFKQWGAFRAGNELDARQHLAFPEAA